MAEVGGPNELAALKIPVTAPGMDAVAAQMEKLGGIVEKLEATLGKFSERMEHVGKASADVQQVRIETEKLSASLNAAGGGGQSLHGMSVDSQGGGDSGGGASGLLSRLKGIAGVFGVGLGVAGLAKLTDQLKDAVSYATLLEAKLIDARTAATQATGATVQATRQRGASLAGQDPSLLRKMGPSEITLGETVAANIHAQEARVNAAREAEGNPPAFSMDSASQGVATIGRAAAFVGTLGAYDADQEEQEQAILNAIRKNPNSIIARIFRPRQVALANELNAQSATVTEQSRQQDRARQAARDVDNFARSQAVFQQSLDGMNQSINSLPR